MPPGVFTWALKVRTCFMAGDWQFWGVLCWNVEEWGTAGGFCSLSLLFCFSFALLGGFVLQGMVWIKQSVSTSLLWGVRDLVVWGWLGSLVFGAVCFQVWVQETRSNILNAGTLLFSMLCAKLCLDALASSQPFNLFFFVSAWIVYIIL